jgi:arylsulfatase A-like enzyme
LIVYDPRLPTEEQGKTSDKMSLNIDIPATILDYAGIVPPELYQGNSLLPIVNDEKIETWRTSFLCEHRFDNDNIPKYVGIREERYVYANYYEQDPPYEYLHDLETDPDQLINLASNPDFKEALQGMRQKCKDLEASIQN